MASDAGWFIPGAILTFGLGAFSLAEMPKYSGVIGALSLLLLWIIMAAAVGAAAILVATFRMMAAGVERPLAKFRIFFLRERIRLLLVLPGLLLTGLNMITFMWVKQLLNYLVPFRADPLLAAADRLIFFTDPWRLLTWLDTWPLAIFYHRGWFALMILALLKLLMSPPSNEKSALLITYFLMWSVFGPVVHVLLPAAGPVFYFHLGYGNRFANFGMPPETQEIADYLWRIYRSGSFGPGAGISAMPSLHIATTAWVVIVAARFARAWLIPVALFASLITLLSVALGWHYAVDGLVGAGGAYLLWRASLWWAGARWISQTVREATARAF